MAYPKSMYMFRPAENLLVCNGVYFNGERHPIVAFVIRVDVHELIQVRQQYLENVWIVFEADLVLIL